MGNDESYRLTPEDEALLAEIARDIRRRPEYYREASVVSHSDS